MSGAYSPELSNPKGSIPGGVLGALLGAIVGAVPYEAALMIQGQEFTGTELWEVTGLVAGYCACLGYRGLRGRRSTSVAYVSVMAAAALVLIGANLAAELYAAGMPTDGMDAVLSAVRRMLGPERRAGLAAGVLWGLLGVWSANGICSGIRTPLWLRGNTVRRYSGNRLFGERCRSGLLCAASTAG